MTRARDLADGADKDITGTLTLDDIVLSNDMSVADNGKVQFGAGNDLQIYHDGSRSYVDDTGTGSLWLRGGDVAIKSAASETMADFANNGAVQLYYDNSVKLATTSTGVDVTGTAVTDGLTVAGNVSVDGGSIKLDGAFPTGTDNTALGDGALDDGSLSGGFNVAIGQAALGENEGGQENVAVGWNSLDANTSGNNNTSLGSQSLSANISGDSNVAVGKNALRSNQTGNDNVAVGQQTLEDNTGSANTAVGYAALLQNTSGSGNTAVGKLALGTCSTISNSTAVGQNAFRNTVNLENSGFGEGAGEAVTSGHNNTFLGKDCGKSITTGTRNTIVGAYNGNQDGLDLRTSSAHIVLSDGHGNPRLYMNASGYLHSDATYANTSGGAANVGIASSGQFYRSTSSLRYKNTINDATHGLTELLTLRPVTYKGNNDGDTIFGGLIAEEVHDAGLTEFVSYNDDDEPDALAYGNMVSLCIKAIQEQQATITALEARIAALEAE